MTLHAYQSAEMLDRRAHLAKEAVDCAVAAGDPALLAGAYELEFEVHVERAELTRAQTTWERRKRLVDELGQPTLRWLTVWQSAGLELLRGDLTAGERLAERAFAIGQEAEEPDAVLIYGAQLSFIRRYQGRGQEVIAVLEQSVKAYPSLVAFRAGLASSLCWLERRAEAAALVEEAASDRFEHILPGPDKSTALALYADAAAQTGLAEAASVLYDLIEPWSDQIVWAYMQGYGRARLYLGLLAAAVGEHDRTDQHLAFACEFHESNGLPLWAARGHLGWAEALIERGDATRAREHAARALELSTEHGYGGIDQRAAALLEAESTTKG